ncbi:MAG TPA: MazG nucleotide pyrophosphohydrolase domain-containing protein, partial [Balneolaceae bacterium]|nr:MazG nucleotide pyrophosphohydrolase domain-containing protein [Balneolaceae bacterium]
SLLDGIPSHLPGLIKAQRMQEKASNVGFDWNDWKLAWEKFEEESEEWKEAVDQQDEESRQEEFGDLLFSLINVGRLLGLNAEDALRRANRKFERRFRYIEEQLSRREKSLADSTLEEMDFYWEEAKKSEKAP